MVSEEGWSLTNLWRGNVFQAQMQKSSKAWQVRSTGGCQCPGAAVTKHRRLGQLKHLSSQPGGQQFKIKVSAGLDPLRALRENLHGSFPASMAAGRPLMFLGL